MEDATFNEICSEIAAGKSLRSICEREDMPDKTTVFRALAVSEERRNQYARARESQADALLEEILEIADDGKSDTYEDAEGNLRTDQDVIARSRLRVDARKWAMSKMAPKKYGDKQTVEQTITAGDPLLDLLGKIAGGPRLGHQ